MRQVAIPAYHLDKLRSDQPSVWWPLAVRACRLACKADVGQSTTFEVSSFVGEQDKATVETLSIVHAAEDPAQLPVVSKLASNEWLQIAAATVIGIFLQITTDAQIQRVCRSENGLSYYLEPREGDDDDSLLIVVGSAQGNAREALENTIEIARAGTSAHKIAAAVAFGSNQAALRVLT